MVGETPRFRQAIAILECSRDESAGRRLGLHGRGVVNMNARGPRSPLRDPVPMTSAPSPARWSHAGAVGTAHITGLLASRQRQPDWADNKAVLLHYLLP
jgi:hypothetical protein